MFFYSENQRYDGPAIDVFGFKTDTVLEKWLVHLDNHMVLLAMSREKHRYSFAERAQIEKELKVCARKMNFWERHPNFDRERASALRESRNKLWKGRV